MTSSVPVVDTGSRKSRPASAEVAGGSGVAARTRARSASPAATTAVSARPTSVALRAPKHATTSSPARGAAGEAGVPGAARGDEDDVRAHRGQRLDEPAQPSGLLGGAVATSAAGAARGQAVGTAAEGHEPLAGRRLGQREHVRGEARGGQVDAAPGR